MRLRLTIFLFSAVVAILFSGVKGFAQYGRGHYDKYLMCEIILEFGTVDNIITFKDVLFSSCSALFS